MIFVDTSAFLAIENRRDAYHEVAVRFRDKCVKRGQHFMTSDYVLDESYTIIRKRAGHDVSVRFGEDLRGSRLLQIEYVTSEIIEEAWRVFKAFPDHDFSFTDCVSFVMMKRLNLRTAFSFDAHFSEYGQFAVNP